MELAFCSDIYYADILQYTILNLNLVTLLPFFKKKCGISK